jgi:hypothetical protein
LNYNLPNQKEEKRWQQKQKIFLMGEKLHDTGKDEAGRPTGTSTARNSTSVNVEEREPIDPEMPNMPPA